MANFPNRVTWMSLGNNVQVKGDLTRRVYRIALRPTYSNPQDRDASTFRHPGTSGLDLLSWTRKHRAELMGAILTIVRAWFAQGQPRPARGVSFGSFEVWERITSGIVETAGMEGFLGNLKVWRSESDFDTQYWQGHLGWLREQFRENIFRAAEVRARAMADPAGYLAPPKLDDPAEKGYGKALGEAYSRLRGRRYGGYWVEKMGVSHGHVTNWGVFCEDDDPPTPGNPEPEPTPPPVVPDPDPAVDDEVSTDPVDKPVDNVVTFDLETGDADDLYKTGPGYVRIGATALDDEEVQAWVPGSGSGPKSRALVPRVVAKVVRTGGTITGHNIVAFD